MSNEYTPQQIEEILQMFFDVAGTRQYIGARYVPIFGRGRGTPIEWDNSDAYEPLSIVYYQGDTYTSRRYVPAGISIDNQDYWVITGRYNAQVEQYRQEVLGFSDRINGAYDAVETLRNEVVEDYVPFPDSVHYPKYGTLGQVLTTLADGETKWEDPVVPSDEQAETVIDAWLTAHPEATTTVQDGAITDAKINANASILLLRSASGVTDLNTVTTIGYYALGYTAAVDNCPIAANSRRLLTVYKLGGNYKAQSIINVENQFIMYWRWTTDDGITWSDWKMRDVRDSDVNANASILLLRSASGVTDLNTVTTAGYYVLGYSASIDNCPIAANSRRLLTVYQLGPNYKVQSIINVENQFIMYWRWTTDDGTTWSAWNTYVPDITDANVNTSASLLLLKSANSVTDLNTVTAAGYYPLGYSASIDNCPIAANSRRLLTVYQLGPNYKVQSIVNVENKFIMYYRWTTDNGTTWSDWQYREQEQLPDLANMLKAPNAGTQGQYSSSYETFTLMTYNVARFNNDTTTYISDEKLSNLKQMLAEYSPDVICAQEALGHIDADELVPTADAVLYPIFKQFGTNYWGLSLWGKNDVSITDITYGTFASGRGWHHGTLNIGSHAISLYNIHAYPGSTTEAVAAREADWTELKTMMDADNATYKIACGDFNARNDATELAFFETTFGTDYYLANGGYIGWFASVIASNLPCDNVIVSKNIVIEKIKPLSKWFKSLYSDHIPVFVELKLMH